MFIKLKKQADATILAEKLFKEVVKGTYFESDTFNLRATAAEKADKVLMEKKRKEELLKKWRILHIERTSWYRT